MGRKKVLKFRNHLVDTIGMKEKSNIIKRVAAVKAGIRIEKIYTPEVISMSMERLFIDVVEEFKKNSK